MKVEFDFGPMLKLATDIDAGSMRVGKAARELVDETSRDLERDWRKNATETAGRHGKHYPKSIKRRMTFGGLGADIEPDAGMRQGGMSFEFGSSKQPPHLDGQRALDESAPRFARRVSALRFLE